MKETEVNRKGVKKRRHTPKARGCKGREDVLRETHGRAKQRKGEKHPLSWFAAVIPVLEFFRVATQ